MTSPAERTDWTPCYEETSGGPYHYLYTLWGVVILPVQTPELQWQEQQDRGEFISNFLSLKMIDENKENQKYQVGDEYAMEVF